MFGSLTGRLLVAHPELDDANFRRAVILVCAHSDAGAFGLMLNRPLEIGVADVLPAWTVLVAEPPVVFSGGPVEPQTAFCLAHDPQRRLGEPISGELRLLDLDTVPPPDDAPARVRVFSGYAGWGPGQLEQEILAEGWRIVDARPEDAFVAQPRRLWAEVYRRRASRIATLPHVPDEPSLN